MSRQQREYFLRQQLRAIQQELGEENLEQAEAALLRKRLEEANLPEVVHKEAEHKLARLARRVALGFAEGQTAPVTVRMEDVPEMLGPKRFIVELARQQLPPGVATGLAWTEAGGDVLYIEATLLPEGSGLTLTGQLSAVMQESAKAAQSFIWSHAEALGIVGASAPDLGYNCPSATTDTTKRTGGCLSTAPRHLQAS